MPLKDSSTIYKHLVEEQTMQGYAPKDIHNLGLREVKRITNLLLKLKRKLKFKEHLQFYKHYKQTFTKQSDVISYSKNFQESIYDKIYSKYFTKGSKKISYLTSSFYKRRNKSRMYAFYIGTQKTRDILRQY